MLTTGLFTTRVFPIMIRSMREPIRIIPFGDVHYGAPGFSEHHWREFISYAKRVRNAYFLGNGMQCGCGTFAIGLLAPLLHCAFGIGLVAGDDHSSDCGRADCKHGK